MRGRRLSGTMFIVEYGGRGMCIGVVGGGRGHVYRCGGRGEVACV